MSRLTPDCTGFLISFCSIALRERPVLEAIELISRSGFAAVELLHPHFQNLSRDDPPFFRQFPRTPGSDGCNRAAPRRIPSKVQTRL